MAQNHSSLVFSRRQLWTELRLKHRSCSRRTAYARRQLQKLPLNGEACRREDMFKGYGISMYKLRGFKLPGTLQ